MIIDTSSITPIIAEIDGVDYPIAEKTIKVADALRNAQRDNEGKPEYKLWLANLEILLGKEAVERLFPNGHNENIDRIHRIHSGVFLALDFHAMATETQVAEGRAKILETVVAGLSKVADAVEKALGVNDSGTDQNG